MHSDFKASQELPSRYIANIEESLQKQADCNWTQAAYHLVVTGNCCPEVKEWLVDQLGERVRTLTRLFICDSSTHDHPLGTQAMGEGYDDWLRKRAAPGP